MWVRLRAAGRVGAVCAGAWGQQTESFRARWQARASATQAAQPHWITPLVLVTPRLEQEFRTDFACSQQHRDYQAGCAIPTARNTASGRARR